MTRHLLVEALPWVLGLCLVGALVLLVRQQQISAGLQRRATAAEDSVRARDEEVRHFVRQRLPALAHCVLSGPDQAVPGLGRSQLHGTAFAKSMQDALDEVSRTVDEARARSERAARSALASIMRSVRGLASEQQRAIEEMLHRHSDPEVAQGLLGLDSANSQFGRRALGAGVLCGVWPGQLRNPTSLVDVVRGAQGQIRDYLRVEISGSIDRAVVSRAVEPVVLAVAELLDNAARHSPPSASVEVSFKDAHHGVSIRIDDAGVGLTHQEVKRAEALLSGTRPVDIHRLGDPAQFGFAVIGQLVSRYGFKVDIDAQSPHGGVRAVVFVPNSLLTELEAPPSSPVMAAPPAPAPPAAAPSAPAPQHAVSAPAAPGARTVHGLPQRRRKPPQHAPARQDAEQPVTEAAANANALGAFARGTRAARSSDTDQGSHPS